MSDWEADPRAGHGEGLLRRWSRRKLEARTAPPVVPAPELPPAPVAPPAPALDLPNPDTLDAGSDYTAFLQKGVPAELQQVALQRAWTSDAFIAGFRGMADYDWDFNAPQYGALWPTDNVAKLIQAVMAPPVAEPSTALEGAPPTLDEAPPLAALDAAPHLIRASAEGGPDDPAPEPAPAPARRHGRALPC